MTQPRVSVIIPTYNRPALLIEAVNSVLSQSYAEYEIILVDDGSSTDTQTELKQAGILDRVRLFRQHNAGLSAARNRGIKEARGKFITFLDDDDLYAEDKLAKQVEYFNKNPDAAMLHSWFSKFDQAHSNLGIRKTSWFRGFIYPQILGQWSLLMAAPCVMVRGEVFERVGFFNESLKMAEDLDMWRRIARHYEFHIIEEPLVRIRRQSTSMSSDKRGASSGFRRMLEAAFEDDSAITLAQQCGFLASMYSATAKNLLGEGSRSDMRRVRADARYALALRPADLTPSITWMVSWLPAVVRHFLVVAFRRLRFSA
jgi:glycosyltransferase involved in cell wall biosynthesis